MLPKEIVAWDQDGEKLFAIEMFDEHAAELKIDSMVNPSSWPEISSKISEALAMMFPEAK